MSARSVLTLLLVAVAATGGGAALARPPTHHHHHHHRHHQHQDAVGEANIPALTLTRHNTTTISHPITDLLNNILAFVSKSYPWGPICALVLVSVAVILLFAVVLVVVVVVWRQLRTTTPDDSEHSMEKSQSKKLSSSPSTPLLSSPASSASPSSVKEGEEAAQVFPICTYLTPRSPDAPPGLPLHAPRDPFDMQALSRSIKP